MIVWTPEYLGLTHGCGLGDEIVYHWVIRRVEIEAPLNGARWAV